MKLKKHLSLLLALLMLVTVLVACGSQNSSTDKSDQSDQNTETEKTKDTSTTQQSEETKDTSTTKETETSTSADKAEGSYQPVSIENFERTIEFAKKPERIVALTLNTAEIIAALGHADLIVGIARNNNVVDDVLPELHPLLKNCAFPEALNSGLPTLEGLLELKPELIIANSYYFNVPKVFGTMEDYKANGVEFYITEGSYVADVSIENTYNDIRNIGAILGQRDKAEELIKNMTSRFEKVTSQVFGKTPLTVMSFDSLNEDGFFIAGGKGLVQNLIELAGGTNVFADVEKQFGSVSIEEIIARKPDVIVIHAYTNNGKEDTQAKVDKLMNSPELSEIPAVKNNNIIIVPLFQANPGLQNVNYVESLAKAMYPDLF